MDVRGERHVAGGFELGVEVAGAVQANEALTADAGFEDLGFQRRGDDDADAFVEVAAGADEGGPVGAVLALGAEEEDLDVAVVARFAAEEAGGKDAGVVDGETVAGAEVGGEVAEGAIFQGAGRAMDDEHAGGGAVREGLLSDQLVRQVIIKFRQ
jgi:hypothetical protein